jgi:hypothetical protein
MEPAARAEAGKVRPLLLAGCMQCNAMQCNALALPCCCTRTGGASTLKGTAKKKAQTKPKAGKVVGTPCTRCSKGGCCLSANTVAGMQAATSPKVVAKDPAIAAQVRALLRPLHCSLSPIHALPLPLLPAQLHEAVPEEELNAWDTASGNMPKGNALEATRQRALRSSAGPPNLASKCQRALRSSAGPPKKIDVYM